MNNKEIAEKIYNRLNEKGAGLGNVSVIFIEGVLNEVLPQANVIKSACPHCKGEPTTINTVRYFFCEKCEKVGQTVL
jgi:hypothetical protein